MMGPDTPSGARSAIARAVGDRTHGGAVTASPSAAGRPRAARPPVRSTATAMHCDPLMPFEVWLNVGERLGRYSNASGWWLGDWLAFGRHKYGRRYKQAIAVTKLDYQTLRNYAVVARRFEPARRRVDVSFQHHAEVCALEDDEQDRWLELAGRSGWSRNELRRRIRADGAPAPPAAVARHVFPLPLDPGREAAWRRAADVSRCDLVTWIHRVLDEAAAPASADADAHRSPPGLQTAKLPVRTRSSATPLGS
jgi:hypothetical protein